jgi:gliding motility-associated-like protein
MLNLIQITPQVKRILSVLTLALLCISMSFKLNAQTPYLMGVTNTGGAEKGTGTVFTYDLNAGNFVHISESDGHGGVTAPVEKFIDAPKGGAVFLASDGLYYITTYLGGAYNLGILYTYDIIKNETKILHHFNVATGYHPVEELVEESGNIYGLTNFGGATADENLTNDGPGVFYKWNISMATYTVIDEFDEATSGTRPSGPLMKHSNGKYYGLTYENGPENGGSLYSINIAAGTDAIQMVRSIDRKEETAAVGGIVEDENGDIIVVTSSGQSLSEIGSITRYRVTDGFLIGSYVFKAAQKGQYGIGFNGIYKASDGNAYIYSIGGGDNGFGCLIRYNLSNAHFGTVHHFGGSNESGQLFGRLKSFNGDLYGQRGGDTAEGRSVFKTSGSLFKINVIDASYEELVLDFKNRSVFNPLESYYVGADGVVIGNAGQGGAANAGGLYTYTSSGDFEVKIDYGSKNGTYFSGGLTTDGHGKFYGVAHQGGNYYSTTIPGGGGLSVLDRISVGTVFEYNYGDQSITSIHNFTGAVGFGKNPVIAPIVASNGKLYGLATSSPSTGGAHNITDINKTAVLYEIDAVTHAYKVLQTKAFTFGDGLLSHYFSSILESSPKVLHFTTLKGIYKYDIADSTLTLVYTMGNVKQGLIKAADGLLYGIASDLNNNPGFLYSIHPTTNAFVNLHTFSAGAHPAGTGGLLVEAANGKLYGTTAAAGANDKGLLFSWEIGTTTFTNLHDFGATATDGATPTSGMLAASNGKLYGMTTDGGANSLGVLYEFDPTGDTFIKLEDFTEQTGGGGRHSMLIEHDVETNANLSSLTSSEGVLEPTFNNAVLDYAGIIPDNISTVPTVSAAPSHTGANEVITQATSLTGSLAERTATVVVTAEDLVTIKTFNVVYSQVSTDATLSSLTVSVGTLLPAFDAAVLVYTDTLTEGTIPIPTVTAIANDPGATVTIRYAANLTGSEGERTTNIDVLAEDGATTKQYTITYFVEKIEKPTSLTSTRNTVSSTALTWTDNSDNEAGFIIERKLSSGSTYTAIDTTAIDATSYEVLLLDCATSYSFRIRGYYSSFVSEYSNESVADQYSYEFTVDGVPLSSITQPITKCDGDVIELEAPPNLKYVWSTTQTTQLIEVRSSGTYSLKVGDDNCFTDNGKTVEIEFNPVPAKPAILVIGDTLTSSEADSFIWYFGTDELSETTRSIIAQNTGFYSVEVANANSCATLSDEISVIVGEESKTDEPIVSSEGFSPNDDGINDTWDIARIENYPNNQVRIFNRSGAVVFEKTGYVNNTNAFDGRATASTVGTTVLPEGTYFYIIDLQNGTDKITGYFTLLR